MSELGIIVAVLGLSLMAVGLRLGCTIRPYVNFPDEGDPMIRACYDTLTQTYVIVRGDAGPDFVMCEKCQCPDNWVTRYPYVRHLLNELLINLDPVEISVDDHFNDTEIDESLFNMFGQAEFPWLLVKWANRTPDRVKFLTENEWARLCWRESKETSAISAFERLADVLSQLHNRLLCTVHDGPCEGDCVYVLDGATRAMVSHDDKHYIYARDGLTLNFVREYTPV